MTIVTGLLPHLVNTKTRFFPFWNTENVQKMHDKFCRFSCCKGIAKVTQNVLFLCRFYGVFGVQKVYKRCIKKTAQTGRKVIAKVSQKSIKIHADFTSKSITKA